MANAYRTHHVHEVAIPGRGLGGLWAAFAERLARYQHYRRTLEELSMLSDRDLADLGIHRSQINEVARDAADRA